MEINKTISPLIERQFPAIYREESPILVAFIKTYYEWAEQEDNFLHLARSLFEARDVDTTFQKYGEHFRTKYLSQLPDVFTDQLITSMIMTAGRFMIKHVLDLYRSKGTERGYEIFFRALYNNDVEFYYPGRNLLRASDGTWIVPQYIEVAYSGDLRNFEGHLIQIINSPSNFALCDRAFRIAVGDTVSTILFLENIYGAFTYGELVHPVNNSSELARIVGSLSSIQITAGGGGYNIGDILNVLSETGVEGLATVKSTVNANGGVTFRIVDGGYGYTVNAVVQVLGGNGSGASFRVGTLANTQTLQIINDQLLPYFDAQLAVWGTIQTGTVSTISGQSNIAGVGSSFNTNFAVNDEVYVIGENATKKITSITNSTLMTVNSVFTTSITGNNIVKINAAMTGTVSVTLGQANVIGVGTNFTANYAVGELFRANNQVASVITSITNTTLLTVSNTFTVTESGVVYYKDYADYSFPSVTTSREFFNTRLKDALNINTSIIGRIDSLTKINPGANYVSDPVVTVVEPGVLAMRISDSANNFWGNNAVIEGTAGNINGIITSVQVIDSGFGYKQGEGVTLFSNANPAFISLGISNVGRHGKKQGYWKNTNGFLNSDKYLIDSLYFQEFSYELQTEKDISIWGDIVAGAIHQAGTKMFGKVVIVGVDPSAPLVVDNVIEQV